ncbi:hypothetical protein ABZ819_28700 [Streptomyces venezuelae]|uniref:hypothetical protein n=1 Tax=Streptomyces venezuelae TaxID=54571 RepID=UPI00341E92B7
MPRKVHHRVPGAARLPYGPCRGGGVGHRGWDLRHGKEQAPPTVRGISVAAGRAADAVCARARGGLTRQEWGTYLPDFPYRRTC